MAKPIRIQRKRTKGWRMPPNTVYVGRPTVFGSPINRKLGPGTGLRLYKYFIRHQWAQLEQEGCNIVDILGLQILAKKLSEAVVTLRGKNLACWCPLDQPCHADILLELANAPGGKEGG